MGAAAATAALEAAVPRSLAAGDLDRDGIPDLVVGYGVAGAGLVVVHPGDPDALFPHTAGARLRRERGEALASPFRSPARAFALPAPADFVAVGDFDADGRLDVAAAAAGAAALHWLPGDGGGGLAEAALRVDLPGALTVLAAGEVNRRDGLADLVAAVSGPDGAALLVFEGPAGALAAEPERIALPAPAEALAVGRVDGDAFRDLVVLTGDPAGGPADHLAGEPAALADGGLLVVRGRDRRLSLDSARRAAVPEARVERLAVAAGGPRIDRALDLLARGIGELGAAAPALGGASAGEAPASAAAVGAATPHLAAWAADPAGGLPAIAFPMRLNRDGIPDRVSLPPGAGAPVVELSGFDAEITVDSVDDTATVDGLCTLREAIGNSNADADASGGDCTAGAGNDLIAFDIPGAGPHTIVLADFLPEVTDPVTIDGYTEPGAVQNGDPDIFDGTVQIVLDGSAIPDPDPDDGNILTISAGSSVVRGLAIQRSPRDGLDLRGAGGNFVEGNLFGTDLGGQSGGGNGRVSVDVSSPSNTIGGTAPAARNLVSGSVGGIVIWNNDEVPGGTDARGGIVQGNLVGTDSTGTFAIPNSEVGIGLYDSTGNTVGGTAAGARNLVSGNGGTDFRGIDVEGIGGTLTEDNLVQGNYVGTDVTGTAAIGNGFAGILVADAVNNTIGGTAPGAGNLVSGNDTWGIDVTWFGFVLATGNLVQGNYVGTDVSGTAALPNGFVGVGVNDADDNTVGGTAAGAGNLISGNSIGGIAVQEFFSSPDDNFIQGNLVGTDHTGTAAIGNGFEGVFIANAKRTVIGGADPGAGNVIAASADDGIEVTEFGGGTCFGNRIEGNHIGVDLTGTVDLGNGRDGVRVSPGCSTTTIGGVAVGAGTPGNVISGNGDDGIDLAGATTATVQGNRIGTDVTGTLPIPNDDDGIRAGQTTLFVTIGGAGGENVIAFNGDEAVEVNEDSVAVAIRFNSMHSNGGLGIDLFPGVGVNDNDPGDGDEGSNDLQNYPVLTSAVPGSADILGSLDSVPSTTFDVDFYANTTCDPAGHGEAETFLGSTQVTTDADGDAPIDVSLGAEPAEGAFITATATDPDGNTSELSACRGFCEAVRAVPDQQIDGEAQFAGCDLLTADDVDVGASGDLTLLAGNRIELGDGFSVATGGVFSAGVDPLLALP